jgi:hypothetical protein
MSSNFTSLNLSSDGLIFEEFAFSMILKSGNSFVVVSSHSNSSVDNKNLNLVFHCDAIKSR